MRPVLAYHIVISTYGFWLPNDERGSNSKIVWADHLRPFGPATFVTDTRSHANDPHDRVRRRRAKNALLYPTVRFTGLQARAVGFGFKNCLTRTGATMYACCILPDHVHMVIARHDYEVEKLVSLLKGDATRELVRCDLHPLSGYRNVRDKIPSPWAASCRKVFLFTPEEIEHRIGYTNANPRRQGKPDQRWSFVTPYSADR
jgi:REP element-mobilizing transposase RayT